MTASRPNATSSFLKARAAPARSTSRATIWSTCAWPITLGHRCCSSGTSTGAASTPPFSVHGCPSPTPNAGCSRDISSTDSGGTHPYSGPRTTTCWLTPAFPCSAPSPTSVTSTFPKKIWRASHGDTPTAGKKRRGHWTSPWSCCGTYPITPTLRRSPPNPTSACVRCAVRRNGATPMW